MSSAPLRSAIVLALLLNGCTVGPDFVRPPTDTDPVFHNDRTVGAAATTLAFDPAATAGADATTTPVAAADESAFWTRFDDPLLGRLVDDALAANHDLRIALARVEQARALARQSRFDQWPTVTAEAGAARLRASTDEAPGVDREARDGDRHDAGVRIGWELDLFGRVRRGVQAQRAESAAAQADFAATQVLVAADVAQTYFELRGRQARLAVARGNAANQRVSLDLVATRLDAGRGTELDTSRAAAQLESTQARIPALEADIAATMHRLAVLTGRQPQALVAELAAVPAPPALPDAVAAGAPGELLRRRPDVAAAEHRLEAATARIGVATADLFPRFTLGALLGSQAGDVGELFGRDGESGFVALGIDWSFLDSGRVRSRIAASEAGADEQLARYERTVLLALEETETALVRFRYAHDETAHLQAAATAGARASELARLRFQGGLVDFLQVLDAERTQLEAEDQLAQARTRQATAVVGVYRALAGGWPEREVVAVR